MKKNLRQARSDAGINQIDIAKKTGVTYQMVYQWEKGFAPVARKHWKAIASLLRVSESELEEILVQTLLDSCVSAGDSRALLNAQTSRLYRSDLLLDAIAEFEGRTRSTTVGDAVLIEAQKLEYERALLERDKKIFELEKQVEELRREIERRRPAVSISSALNIEPIKNEVKR